MADRIERAASRTVGAARRVINYEEAQRLLQVPDIPPAAAVQAYATLALADAVADLRAEIAAVGFSNLSNASGRAPNRSTMRGSSSV